MSSSQKPDLIRAALLAGILRGDFGTDDARLPREEDLAEAFEVARPTLRSAVQGLKALGIVTVKHGRPGAVIRPAEEWALHDVELLELVLTSAIAADVLAEALECRLLVAPQAAAFAAERATDEDIARIEAALERAKEDGPAIGSPPAPELEFHRAVMAASHNRFLAHVAVPIEAALAPRVKHPPASARHEERIFDAVRARDPAAAREAMTEWLVALTPRRLRARKG